MSRREKRAYSFGRDLAPGLRSNDAPVECPAAKRRKTSTVYSYLLRVTSGDGVEQEPKELGEGQYHFSINAAGQLDECLDPRQALCTVNLSGGVVAALANLDGAVSIDEKALMNGQRLMVSTGTEVSLARPAGPSLSLAFAVQQSHTYVNDTAMIPQHDSTVQTARTPCLARQKLTFGGQRLQSLPTQPSSPSWNHLGQFCNTVGLFVPDATVQGPRDYCTSTQPSAPASAPGASPPYPSQPPALVGIPMAPKYDCLSFPNLLCCFKAASASRVYNIFISDQGALRANVDGFQVQLRGLIGSNLCAWCECMLQAEPSGRLCCHAWAAFGACIRGFESPHPACASPASPGSPAAPPLPSPPLDGTDRPAVVLPINEDALRAFVGKLSGPALIAVVVSLVFYNPWLLVEYRSNAIASLLAPAVFRFVHPLALASTPFLGPASDRKPRHEFLLRHPCSSARKFCLPGANLAAIDVLAVSTVFQILPPFRPPPADVEMDDHSDDEPSSADDSLFSYPEAQNEAPVAASVGKVGRAMGGINFLRSQPQLVTVAKLDEALATSRRVVERYALAATNARARASPTGENSAAGGGPSVCHCGPQCKCSSLATTSTCATTANAPLSPRVRESSALDSRPTEAEAGPKSDAPTPGGGEKLHRLFAKVGTESVEIAVDSGEGKVLSTRCTCSAGEAPGGVGPGRLGPFWCPHQTALISGALEDGAVIADLEHVKKILSGHGEAELKELVLNICWQRCDLVLQLGKGVGIENGITPEADYEKLEGEGVGWATFPFIRSADLAGAAGQPLLADLVPFAKDLISEPDSALLCLEAVLTALVSSIRSNSLYTEAEQAGIRKYLGEYDRILLSVVERHAPALSLATLAHWLALLSSWISLDPSNHSLLHLLHPSLDILRDEYWRRVAEVDEELMQLFVRTVDNCLVYSAPGEEAEKHYLAQATCGSVAKALLPFDAAASFVLFMTQLKYLNSRVRTTSGTAQPFGRAEESPVRKHYDAQDPHNRQRRIAIDQLCSNFIAKPCKTFSMFCQSCIKSLHHLAASAFATRFFSSPAIVQLAELSHTTEHLFFALTSAIIQASIGIVIERSIEACHVARIMASNQRTFEALQIALHYFRKAGDDSDWILTMFRGMTPLQQESSAPPLTRRICDKAKTRADMAPFIALFIETQQLSCAWTLIRKAVSLCPSATRASERRETMEFGQTLAEAFLKQSQAQPDRVDAELIAILRILSELIGGVGDVVGKNLMVDSLSHLTLTLALPSDHWLVTRFNLANQFLADKARLRLGNFKAVLPASVWPIWRPLLVETTILTLIRANNYDSLATIAAEGSMDELMEIVQSLVNREVRSANVHRLLTALVNLLFKVRQTPVDSPVAFKFYNATETFITGESAINNGELTAKQNSVLTELSQWAPRVSDHLRAYLLNAMALKEVKFCNHKNCFQCTAPVDKFMLLVKAIKPHAMACGRPGAWAAIRKGILAANRRRAVVTAALEAYEATVAMHETSDWITRFHLVGGDNSESPSEAMAVVDLGQAQWLRDDISDTPW